MNTKFTRFMRTLFNDKWSFKKTAPGVELGSLDDSGFNAVDLPHDWLIYDAKNLYESSYGWYKRVYNAGEKPAKSIRLYFGGVYMDCTVYVNGKPAFDWRYGYSSFEADIAEFVHAGENEIVVLVRHVSPNTRWYSGAGIYRDVYLTESEQEHIKTDGVYFSAKRDGDEWKCEISAKLCGDCTGKALDIAVGELYHTGITIGAGSVKTSFSVTVPKGEVWDIDNPYLHNLTVTLSDDNNVYDQYNAEIGFREARFDSDSGFYLNGRHVKLRGVCLHHDLGSLGAAFNKDEMRRRLLLLREMGANAVRTSHNMPSVGFMELCDELGFLVDSEAYDMWGRPKTEFDNARFFDECYKKDIASWICRDRNHPSVIMWSIGNEIYDTHGSERGYTETEELCAEVKKHDYCGNAFVTFGSNYLEWEPTQKCAELLELVGYNYGERLYEKHHKAYPKWCIYGSETTAGVKSRGVYHFPYSSVYLTHSDMQCSSLGNCRAGKSADTAAEIIEKDNNAAMSAGMFIWTGIDYIGEPTPYSTKNSYYGPLDTAGIKKDAFWLYQAAWTDKPVLHFLPYWDFNEGQTVDICAYTNLTETELFVNGVSCGVRKPELWQARWTTEYCAGEIKVVGRTADGELIEDTHHSFGDSVGIVLRSNKSLLPANGIATAAVEISTVDENGYPVENARDYISISVTGGRLLGFDNGDSTDYDNYKTTIRKLFSGRATAIVAADGKAEPIVVKATGEGLKSAELTIETVPSAIIKGVSFTERLAEESCNAFIPVRKIALSTDGLRRLTPERQAISVSADIYPKNATVSGVDWSIVNDSGLTIESAQIAVSNNTAVITALGDGSFRVRCSCSNGKPFPEVISELELSAEGLGMAVKDAYRFIRGGLYDATELPVDEVSEGGVSIPVEKNRLTYEKVDFGEGSDSLSVSMIHWHTGDPIKLRLYCDNELLGEYEYKQEFIWQTYIPQSYSLPHIIRGLHTIAFEVDRFQQRLYFGGFQFIKSNAYGYIRAVDRDLIHGDTYAVNADLIEHIGNNVVVSFKGLGLPRGANSITLFGRTNHSNDSVHLLLTGDNGSTRGIMEFGEGSGITAVTEMLNVEEGCYDLDVIFLPGCDFDFKGLSITGATETE